MLDLYPPGILIYHDRKVLSLVTEEICCQVLPWPAGHLYGDQRLKVLAWLVGLACRAVSDELFQLMIKVWSPHSLLSSLMALTKALVRLMGAFQHVPLVTLGYGDPGMA